MIPNVALFVKWGHAGKYWLREGHSQICKNSSHYSRDWCLTLRVKLGQQLKYEKSLSTQQSKCFIYTTVCYT